MNQKTLYERLGGYDGITAFVNDLMPRLQADAQLGRFWQNRGTDGLAREKQLSIDFLSSRTGGPLYYTGRDMKLSHEGMKISELDWSAFLKHAEDAMKFFQMPQQECDEVTTFIMTLKHDMVEV